MGDKEDYLTPYRVFFETFAATVNPEDQLPVNIAGYTITESELPGEVLYWTTQYLTEKQCPLTLMTPLRRIILEEVRVAARKCPNEFGYRSDESVYIALRLMQAVTALVNRVCLRYLDNARLDSLPPPPPLAQRDLKTVSCATKNSRRVMEDRHVEIGNLEALFGIDTTEPTSFYAVYDGHAGSAAATYCAAHLHQYLVESAHFTTDLRKAMREAFLRTDAEFIRKSNQERACGGSTAVAVCVRGRKLLAAWAGDSLALLAKRMRLMQLVRPHKPSREDERDRIESSGGSVMYWGTWRVNGQLAVSRAIGDAQYKPYVTARPEIATVDLDGDEDFVVVACDGLWDFVSEDDVALAVYRQLAVDPDDLKAVTKRLIVQAKRQGSADNISIIVVFLKEPRDIAADNRPPMDLGLDNALANAPPFVGEGDTEACKQPTEEPVAAADNGVDNSDSDSEDLGPETAVDADDIDADRHNEPAPPTPPAHAVEAGHVDGALVDNVAESGDDSEDEWNYFKGEGERDQNPAEETDELPRSDTPGHDNSAWETSSVDMNSSPLNPDAPVFIPGSVPADVLLAESPRKPVPMDDIELPDVAQFQTEAVVRPAELLDLDNCDQLNGHHNVSMSDEAKERLNGNDKCTMDSLGFGFNVGIEPDKVKDSGLIQDFERIQKDTTDFCNIQVFQTHSETNPFAAEGNDELFERLKNKERDPMSMSFYQEKDDDTCERILKDTQVDLNSVQPLPDSDDEDLQTNGICDDDKENISPDQHTNMFAVGDVHEPNNDIMRFDERTDLAQNIASFGEGDNCMDYLGSSDNMSYPTIELEPANIPQDTVLQTDTPESHKLLFEQIPEIPDGKSSELGFTDENNPSESEKDLRVSTPQDETSQDVEMESKLDSPIDDLQPVESDRVVSPESIHLDENVESALVHETQASPVIEDNTEEAITPEPTHGQTDVEIHRNEVDEIQNNVYENPFSEGETGFVEQLEVKAASPVVSPVPTHSPVPSDAPHSPEPVVTARSPLQSEEFAPSHFPSESPAPEVVQIPVSPLPSIEPVCASPVPEQNELEAPVHSPLPTEPSPEPTQSPLPADVHRDSPLPRESPLPETDALVCAPIESKPVALSPLPTERVESKENAEVAPSPVPADVPLPGDSPAPPASPVVPRDPTPQPEPEPDRLTLEPEPSIEPTVVTVAQDVPLAAPAPDLVPAARADPVTDMDVGVPESRAHEICVPVTSEIGPEDGEHVATPPPTPAVDAPTSDVTAAATAAAVAATAAVAAAAIKSKTPAKKSPTTPSARTPKSTAKPAAATPRTPASATKKTATPARTPASAPRPAPVTKTASPAVPKPAPAAAKVPPAPRVSATRPAPTRPVSAAAPPKPAPKAAAPASARSAPVPRAAAKPAPPAARPASARPASATKPAPTSAPTAARPAPRPAPPSTARPAPRPAPTSTARPAPAAARTKKVPEKKPLTNGEVQEPKPAPRPAPITRPAPRPAPRATPPATAPPKAGAPRPVGGATRAPLDKQTKDLANKRITAKAAPPRTASTKAAVGAKTATKIQSGPKKVAETAPPATNGLPTEDKAPPSPPAGDNALLPDVIA